MKLTETKKLWCLSVLLLLFAGCWSEERDPASVVIGSQAPSFSLTSVDGARLESAALMGSVVVLNFWATWCQPCMTEIPELKEIAANSKVKVVGIALDENANAIKPFVASNRINYTVLVGNEDVFQRFNGVGIPYTLVLDQSQRIVKIYRGPTTKKALEEDFKEINQGSLAGNAGRH